MTTSPFTVSVEWLREHLDDPSISIVDASWYLPTMLVNGEPRNGKAEFEVQHIPGAVFFNIDAISQPGSPLPHTLASPELFAQKVGELGISDQHTIVVYDGIGLFSAPRVWWNFRIMGAAKVVILDGGFPAWLEARMPVESGQGPARPATFKANFDNDAVASFKAMQSIVSAQDMQIADARPEGRFAGRDAEPRAGMRSGHMPGAHSVPSSALAQNGRLRSADELRNLFSNAGVDLEKPVVTTCGSGVTAAALILALETIGHKDHKLYDGSWSEWGGREDTPIIKDD